MAQLIQPFNANNYDPTQGVGGLPIGRHPVVIQSSDVKATKANDGGYLQLDLLITDGPNKGTVGAYRINLYNASEVAVGIANKQMSAISHVTGVFQIQDTQQLHNIPFVIEVGPQKNSPEYTEVKKVFDMNGNEPGQAPAGGGAAQTQGQGGFGGQAQGQQQQPPADQGQGGAGWGGGQAQGGGQQQDPNQGQGQAQGGAAGGWQPPAGGGQQQEQPPANQGGGAGWGGAPQGQGGGNPPADQGGQAQGGWQQGAAPGGNAGGAGGNAGGAGGPWGGGQR